MYIKCEDYNEVSKKRLMIDGSPKDYPTYNIPISLLYYNYSNGRIATSIEQYNATHDGKRIEDLLESDKEAYNDTIGQYVIDSANDSGKSYKTTRDDIEKKGQQEAGVILTDGRIIDGNRRFTALRELNSKPGINSEKFGYFECVVLDAPTENDNRNWQRIKKLELYLQFNKDVPRDYDPIDRVAAFYHDTKSFTEKEYCDSSGMSRTEYKNLKYNVDVALDYLNYLGKGDESFYLLKIDKLDGPIKEIAKAWAKGLSDFKKQRIRDYVYPYITLVVTDNEKINGQGGKKKNAGDRTKDTRRLINSVLSYDTLGENYANKVDNSETIALINEAVNYKVEYNEGKDKGLEINQEQKTKINTASETLLRAFRDASFKSEIESSKNEPIETLEQVEEILSKLASDTGSIRAATRNSDDKDRFDESIDNIKICLDIIKSAKNEW